MNKLFKTISLFVCSILVTICAISTFTNKIDNSSTPVRDVELYYQNVGVDSSFKEFEDYELEFKEQSVNFVGYNEISLSEFEELDLISIDDKTDTVTTKYICTYDYENGIVSLSVYLISNEETSIIDTMYGVIIMDEEENFDVVFDCEGEVLLLSELKASGVIENCGFFSKLKKVWNSTAGKIGTIVTVAACAVVGVVCAVVPGGQLVTALCLGAALGAIGGAITAGVATYIEDGVVDWGAVLCYAGAGAAVGAATSVLSFKITCKLMPKNTMSSILKSADNNPASNTTYIGKYYKDSPNSYEKIAQANNGNYFNLDNYDYLVKKYGPDAMEEVNKNFIITKFDVGNNIISTTNPYNATGAFAKEIQWLKEMGGTTWKKIGENLWQLMR